MCKQVDFPKEFFTNQLYISTCLTESIVDQFDRELGRLRGRKRIFVFLESLGGDVFPALQMYNKVKNFPDQMIGIAGGRVSSVAVVFFQAFGLRLIRKQTKMFLHNITQTSTFEFKVFVTNVKKSHDNFDKEFCLAVEQQKNINGILANSTGMSEEEVKSLLKTERVLSAEEILKLGLADAIYDPEDFR